MNCILSCIRQNQIFFNLLHNNILLSTVILISYKREKIKNLLTNVTLAFKKFTFTYLYLFFLIKTNLAKMMEAAQWNINLLNFLMKLFYYCVIYIYFYNVNFLITIKYKYIFRNTHHIFSFNKLLSVMEIESAVPINAEDEKAKPEN